MSNYSESEKATIIAVARIYIHTKKATMKSVGDIFGLSAKTVSKYLNEDIMNISPRLYGKVQEKKAMNILKNRKNFSAKKESWLSKIFKKH